MDLPLPDDIQLESPTAADQIAAALRGYILGNTLAPGTALREVPLSEAFEVSRNTIREAIRILAYEGLVSQRRHRSAVVTQLTEADVCDLYTVRRLLELSALSKLEAMPEPDLEQIEDAYQRFARFVSLGDWSRVTTADLEFHASIVALHRSQRLNRCFASIKSELAFCLTVIRVEEDEEQQPERQIEEHDRIRQAILARDEQRARRLLENHLAYYGELARKGVSKRAGTEADAQPRP